MTTRGDTRAPPCTNRYVPALSPATPTFLRPRGLTLQSSFRVSVAASPVPSYSSPTCASRNWQWVGGARQGSGEGWAFWQVTQSIKFLICPWAPPGRSPPHPHLLALLFLHPGFSGGLRDTPDKITGGKQAANFGGRAPAFCKLCLSSF